MKPLIKKFSAVTLSVLFVGMLFVVSGCGDDELTKNITDTVKKSAEAAISKKGNEIKQQINQAINLGSEKSGQENGQAADKEGGKGESVRESEEDKD